jgi:outer membrane protein assembly factor BamD (BamD/ComL family)
VNAARVALSAGDRPRALELLERFETQFPEGVLRPEAAILRIEALVASGDRPAAARAARAFLAANPSSPYAPRIQRLLSQSNP